MDLLDQLRVSRGFDCIVYPTTSGKGGEFDAMTFKEFDQQSGNESARYLEANRNRIQHVKCKVLDRGTNTRTMYRNI